MLAELLHGFLVQLRGDPVDADVEGADDGEGDPEVHDLQEGIEDNVLHVLNVAHARLDSPHSHKILPPEYRSEKQDGRNDPRDTHDLDHLSFRSPVPVLGRNLNGTESVDRDAKYRVDGTEAGGVVDGQPEIAEHLAEGPLLAGQEVNRVEGHGDGTDEHVAARQRSDEVVGGLSDCPVDDEGQKDNQVAEDGQQNDRCRPEPDGRDLQGGELSRFVR